MVIRILERNRIKYYDIIAESFGSCPIIVGTQREQSLNRISRDLMKGELNVQHACGRSCVLRDEAIIQVSRLIHLYWKSLIKYSSIDPLFIVFFLLNRNVKFQIGQNRVTVMIY